MEVIPALDLREGEIVRLYQGDYHRQTVYSGDPLAVALEWERQGAPRLHIVDLDGAIAGSPVNLEVVSTIVSRVHVPLQLGGGIRTLETAQRIMDMGVDRIVLGTAAVEEPALVQEALNRFGDQAIIVGVDAREGRVAVRGWLEQAAVSATELVHRMTALGVRRFLFTDIGRDGTLTEPNFDSISQVVQSTEAAVVASGGISSIDHVKRLAEMGVEGAIIGSALYTGRIHLQEALQSLAEDI